MLHIFLVQTHAVVWVLFGVVLAAFIVAFALIGVALNPGSDNVKLSNDPFAPSGHVFGGMFNQRNEKWKYIFYNFSPCVCLQQVLSMLDLGSGFRSAI